MLLMNRDVTFLDVTFSDVFTDSLDVLKLGGLEEPQSLPADSGIITKLELGLPDSPWKFSGNIQWGADQNSLVRTRKNWKNPGKSRLEYTT